MKHLTWKCIILISCLLPGFSSFAQAEQHVEMATGMRSNGKIFVVVAVLVMILLGLFFYLFSLDKKISKLEKEQL